VRFRLRPFRKAHLSSHYSLSLSLCSHQCCDVVLNFLRTTGSGSLHSPTKELVHTSHLFVHFLITLLSSFTQCLLWNLFSSLSMHVSKTWYLQTSKESSNELHYQFHPCDPCDPISCNVRINVNGGRVVAYVFYTIISHGGHVYAMLSTKNKFILALYI
jgi:hypothetical protein